MNDHGNKHKEISIMSLIILIIIILFSYLQYDDYASSIEEYEDLYNAVRLEEANYIKTVFSAETSLAKKALNIHVERIQDQLILYYGKNLDGLDDDIDNPSSNSELTKVFDNVLGEFYINNNTNINKPFVLSMNNLLWGRCLSYDSKDEFLTIEDLISMQSNNDLNTQSILTILENNDDEYIFWQNRGKNEIKKMNIDDLIEIYFRDGLDSMKNYELLVPIYITKDGDIFGTKDTDGLGHKVTNYKIIIVQRINMYDALNNYIYELSFYESQCERIENQKMNNISYKTRSLMISAGLILIVLFGSAYLQNKKYK